MSGLLYRLAGAAGYLLAVLPMVYFVGFVGGFAVPKHVDSGVAGGAASALAIDLALLVGFAVVHSVLAREPVRRRLLARWPRPLERSLYSAVAGLQIMLLMALWRPLPGPIWSLAGSPARVAAWTLFGLGWALVVWALAAIDGARLFGLRQAWAAARGERDEEPPFVPRGPYLFLRHPLYAGTVAALFAAAEMSRGRLLLASVLTAYILVGARLEERDLERVHGDAFREYRAGVPGYLPGRSRG